MERPFFYEDSKLEGVNVGFGRNSIWNGMSGLGEECGAGVLTTKSRAGCFGDFAPARRPSAEWKRRRALSSGRFQATQKTNDNKVKDPTQAKGRLEWGTRRAHFIKARMWRRIECEMVPVQRGDGVRRIL